jgi:hypothetical protein
VIITREDKYAAWSISVCISTDVIAQLFAVGANLRRFPTSGLDPIVSFAFLATFGAILGTLVKEKNFVDSGR